MTHVSLFTGIGGIDLAAEWAGFRTIAQVERDPYCLRVLERHWPGVHRCTDVRDFPDETTARILADAYNRRCSSTLSQHEQDTRKRTTTSSTSNISESGSSAGIFSPVTLVSGGFPCQPFSAAGKRKGTADDRHLWPEMYRVVCALAPRWIVAENVPGLLSLDGGMVFESVCADLERAGYTVQTVVVPAAGVGAPHLRQRVFVVAHRAGAELRNESGRSDGANGEGAAKPGDHGTNGTLGHAARGNARQSNEHQTSKRDGAISEGYGREFWNESCRPSPDVADAASNGDRDGQECSGRHRIDISGDAADPCCPRLEERDGSGPWESCTSTIIGDWWAVEPAVGRVAHGVPKRVDRLRCLGNAVVPQQVYPILAAIAEVEREQS